MPTDCWAKAVAGRSVGSEISNMLAISQRLPFARRRRSSDDQSASSPINRPHQQGDRRYNRSSVADCTVDHSNITKWVWPLMYLYIISFLNPFFFIAYLQIALVFQMSQMNKYIELSLMYNLILVIIFNPLYTNPL